ncbi:hypothetical protein ACS0TY_008651 [Phlomoides rotata]
MTVRSAASSHCKKALEMGLSLFRNGFKSSKCKTMAKMAVARIKLLRNKREVVIRQMRRDIAMLLESGQDSTARIRVEHVIREQNIMAANELIELFCELIVSRLAIIAKQRECPADLKEGISSVIFAGPRCSEIPELLSIRDVFQKKYGKDFVSAATDLRPNAGVNRLLIEKLSVKTPPGEIKLKVLKEIAKEYQVQWDTAESEEELLKPPEQRIEGPNNFASAASLPLNPVQKQTLEASNASNRGQRNINITSLDDVASAAGFAAEKALAAAEAAALLARAGRRMSDDQRLRNSLPNSKADEFSTIDRYDDQRNYPVKTNSAGYYPSSNAQEVDDARKNYPVKTNSAGYYPPSDTENEQREVDDARKLLRRMTYNCDRKPTDIKFDDSDYDEEIEMEAPPSSDTRKVNRRHSYNVPPTKSEVRYDQYDDDEYDSDGDAEERPRGNRPPDRPAPHVPVRRVHPKLPDYDILAARFEALRHDKKQP